MGQPSPPDTAQEGPHAGPSTRAETAPYGWLVLILLLALALRLWGITWALPNAQHTFSYHPDEGVNLVNGLLAGGSFRFHLDLGFYNYGSLYFYLWQAAVAMAQTYTHGAGSIAGYVLTGRCVSALLGAATTPLVYVTGRRLFSRPVGLVAALLYAVMPLAVVHAHFATVDVTATFFVTLALAAGSRLVDRLGLRESVVAGLCCGLAAAAKYNCGLVLAAPVAAAVIHKESLLTLRLRAVGLVIAGAAAGFLIACPGVFLNSGKVWQDFGYELHKSQEGMGLLFVNTASGWVYHLTESLRYGLGLPMLLLCLAGAGWALWRRSPTDIYLLAFALLYYAVIGAAQVKFMRYVIPLMPVLALFGGRLVMDLRWNRLSSPYVTTIPLLLVVPFTVILTLALDRLMVLPDVRDVALRGIHTLVPAGSVIGFARLPWYDVPPLSPDFTAPNAATRKETAQSVVGYTLRVPESDLEAAYVFAPPPPSAVVLSDIATEDWARLDYPGWKPFKSRLDAEYVPTVYQNLPSFAGISFGKPDYVPNDLLYIYPRVTLYRHR